MKFEDMLINLENLAMELCGADRKEEVANILNRWGNGATSIDDLTPCCYQDVFNEMFQRVIDLDD